MRAARIVIVNLALTGALLILVLGATAGLETEGYRLGTGDDPWAGTPPARFLESAVVQRYQCDTCHTFGERGGTVGPKLNQVANRRSPEWLRRWLTDPNAIKPGTKMPKFDFTPEELEATLGHLTSMRRVLRRDEIVHGDRPEAERGEALFRELDCLACHRLGDEGRFVGPNLTWIGARKNRDWERTWLHDPDAWKPGTFMPNFHLSDQEIEVLTAFLASQRGRHNDAARNWEFNTNFYLNNRPRQRGELIFQRFACNACHGDAGRGGIRNPNAAPDESMPRLRRTADRLTRGELAAILSQVQVPERLDPDGPEPPFACPAYAEQMTEQELSDLYAYLRAFLPRKSRFKFKLN